MNIFSEQKFLVGSIIILIAACIVAGTVVWHGMRTSQTSVAVGGVGQEGVFARSDLPPGTPNPADSLRRHPVYQSVVGEIVSVGQGSFTIARERSSTATILVDSNTILYTPGSQKDEAVFQKEMDEFLKAFAYSTTGADVVYVAPTRYEKIPLTLSDLKPGLLVSVSMLTGLDKSSTIRAAEVFVQKQP